MDLGEINGDFPEADFWPALLRVHPGHNFRLVRDSGVIFRTMHRQGSLHFPPPALEQEVEVE